MFGGGIVVDCYDQMVVQFVCICQIGDMIGMQNVEDVVGYYYFFVVFVCCCNCLFEFFFVYYVKVGFSLVVDCVFQFDRGNGGCIQFIDYYVCCGVSEIVGFFQGVVGCQGCCQYVNYCVVGVGYVVYFLGLGWYMQWWMFWLQQCYFLFRVCYQQC